MDADVGYGRRVEQNFVIVAQTASNVPEPFTTCFQILSKPRMISMSSDQKSTEKRQWIKGERLNAKTVLPG